MVEGTKGKKKIHFFKEKKWIVAYWFKTHRNAQLTGKYVLDLWCKWWKNDFTGKSDERFQDILPWIKEVVNTMTRDEVKQKRHDIADCSPMPQYIKRLACKKGYYVKKCSTRKHPLRVSGYAIFKNQRDKTAVYGKNFDLTLGQVREFLESKEDALKPDSSPLGQ